MPATIDTGKCTQRRALRFETIDDALREVDRLAAAERAGGLDCLGNWTFGQILGHLATWVEFAYTGAPIQAPWIIRLILRATRKKYIYGQMPAGRSIPNVEGGTLGTEPMSLDDGLARYRAAMQRLSREVPTAPSPAFGPLTHAEAIQLNLRHAELHLGFLKPRS